MLRIRHKEVSVTEAWKFPWFLLLYIHIIFAGETISAQSTNLRFQHLTIENGLPQNMVDCMIQDRHGFMWLGTWNGLCKYDGYRFEVFNGESHGINNFIQSLYEDINGNIWIGTREGVYVFIYDQRKFIQVDLQQNTTKIEDNISVTSIIGGDNDEILIGSHSGIFRLKLYGSKGKYEVIDFVSIQRLEGASRINALLVVKGNKQLWVGTNEGIIILSDSGELVKKYINDNNYSRSLSSNLVTCFHQETNGRIWIGTEYGLNYFDSSTEDFVRNSQSMEQSVLPHEYVMDIAQDADGNLIIATLGGIAIHDKENESYSIYTEEGTSHHSLNNNFANCLLTDDHGNIWIGTERGGVNLYNENQSKFEHYETNPNTDNSLNHGTVNSIYEDDENIWIGTAGGGLNRYDKLEKKFYHYRYAEGNQSSISGDFVTFIYRDNKQQLWIGTWGGGINKVENEGKEDLAFVRYDLAGNESNRLNFVSSIDEDDRGNLWIGSLGGLSYYDQEQENFSQLYNTGTHVITEVGVVLQDGISLWVGTRTGLYRIDNLFSDKERIQKYTHNKSDEHSISGDYVISIHRQKNGVLWFGTYGNGINRYRRDEDNFSSYSSADGLSNNIIYTIEESDEGNLWMSSDYGIIRFNTESGEVRNFFMADGLLNNQYYWSSSYKNEDGKLYFGGMDGMDAFFPEWINEKSYQIIPLITDIALISGRVNPGKKYNGVKVVNGDISEAEEIHLSYKEKMLNLEFSPLIYRDAELLNYAYILEGFEEDWNDVSPDRRFATYTNLLPGNYTFKVKVSNANGEFNTTPRELAIVIHPPFWAMAWFRILMILSIIGIVVGYIKWRMYTLKKQKIRLEKEVKVRTEKIRQQTEALSDQAIQLKNKNQQLEEKQTLIQGQNKKLEQQNWEILAQRDKLIELNNKLKIASQSRMSFFTNISHEFRTPLTLILGPMEKLLKNKDLSPDVQDTIKMMNRSGQRLLHLINQMLNVRKMDKMKMDLKVTAGDIKKFCKEILEAFQPLAEGKNIELLFESSNVPEKVWFDSEKLSHILYNLMSNAFKYTPEGGQVKLDLSILTDKQLNSDSTLHKLAKGKIISIKVIDTGIGISEENVPLVFDRFYRIASNDALPVGGSGIGLSLTKEMVFAHHGNIDLTSELGLGSTFEVQLPAGKEGYLEGEIVDHPIVGFSMKEQVAFLKEEIIHTGNVGYEELKAANSYDSNRPKVLIVEDNYDLRSFLASRLNENFEVVQAIDGKEGIQMAKIHNPDIIVSDLMMPNVDGFELCVNIKNHLDTSHIPIILLTAKNTVSDQITGLEMGADDYLPKPFNFELLLARINNLIDSRNKLRMIYLGSPAPLSEEVTTNQKDSEFLEKAIETVHKNLDNSNFKVGEFIKVMGVSRSLLHKKLSSLTNQSATEFINHIRMQKASQLLKIGNKNISEVAYAVGYSDPKYFSRLFSKHFGQSPKSYSQKALDAVE